MLKGFTLSKTVKRFLNLHEYQASQVLSSYNLPTPHGGPAKTPTEAFEIAKQTQTKMGYVLKAQVHSGGRGRGKFQKSGLQGGVQILKSPEEVKKYSEMMLGDVLVTKQSGQQGKPCNTVYVVEQVNIKKELYLSIMLDRENACPLVIASPQGGMGIEEIDSKFILQQRLNPKEGMTQKDIDTIVNFMELKEENQKRDLTKILQGLYQCFMEKCATLVEINPLGIVEDGRVLVCDSKVKIDDNAHLKLKDLFSQEDQSQRDPLEIKAEKYELNYVKLDGNIGCMVNGAGLAMATMDLVNFKGGKPANFLDIGGGSNINSVKEAIGIINEDQDVKVILINIFGGIVRCDIVAQGVIEAINELGVKKPIVMRIKGNRADDAKELVEKSKLNLYWCNDVGQATEKAISLVQIN